MPSTDLARKKLLYLGGIARASWVVMRARELGIHVLVADYNEDSPAKAVADEGVLIDALDVDALVELGRERQIDGVMTGYCDILLPICRQVALKLGLPCYMTEDMIRVTTDKGFFKTACSRHGVPVPRQYEVNALNLEKSAQQLHYPIFIKPMDASGARGASACLTATDFTKLFESAKSFSPSGRVSVEECLKGTAFILDYALVRGEAHLLSMADCYASDGRSAAVNSPNLMILPSKNIQRYLATVDKKVKQFFSKSGFRDGLFFFQGYADDERITFYEAGCRLGGTWPYIDEFYYGINPLDMLFRHALVGEMLPPGCPADAMNGIFDGMAAIVYFISTQTAGKITKTLGVDAVSKLPYVVNLMQYYHDGDTFNLVKDRQSDTRFLSVHLVAKNIRELLQRIAHVYSCVDFIGEDGRTLLSPLYDLDRLPDYERNFP